MGQYQAKDGFINMVLSGTGTAQMVSVTYGADAEARGITWLQAATPQNLSNYLENGKLMFDLWIDSYGDSTSSLIVKMEDTANKGFEYPLARLSTGSWHSVDIPIKQLINDADIPNIKAIDKPFAITPSWAASQAGVRFQYKNVRFKQ